MNTQTKHTPGPWSADRISIIHGAGRIVAHTEPIERVEGLDERTANATLIAAAPELLAAVKRFVNYGNVFLHHFSETSPYDDALAAIAKAEGR